MPSWFPQNVPESKPVRTYEEGFKAGQEAMRKRAADVTELWDRTPVKVQDAFFEQFDNPRDIFEQGEIEACTSVQYGILALPIEESK